MAPLMTPRVKTDEAVDHDKQGTRTTGFGQLEAAKEAIYMQNPFVYLFSEYDIAQNKYK